MDDEPYVLDGITRSMAGSGVDLALAAPAAEALEVIEAAPDDFGAIISDLNMPGMTGIELLERVKDVAPITVRVLLTGAADLNSTISAINHGFVFRFMLKPVRRDELFQTIDAAMRQHELLAAETVLLEHTLRGCISALTDALALARPAASARAGRISRLATEIADTVDAGGWEIEIAAQLSQPGMVTIDDDARPRGEAGSEDARSAVCRQSRRSGTLGWSGAGAGVFGGQSDKEGGGGDDGRGEVGKRRCAADGDVHGQCGAQRDGSGVDAHGFL